MSPFTFTWEAAVGAQIATATVNRAAVELLTTDLPLGQKYRVKKTEPLSRPTLFREFADLDGADAVLAFATAHGMLGLPPREALLPADRTGDRFVIHGELLTDWQQQAKYLRRALACWQRGQHHAVNEAVTPFLESVSPRFLSDSERSGLVFEPHNLLAAIWLQFALAVCGVKEFAVCGGCGAWIGRGKYCNGACRQRAYRMRKSAES